MFRSFRAWVLLTSLTMLGVLALQSAPGTSTPVASAPGAKPIKDATNSIQTENARALLGEKGAEKNPGQGSQEKSEKAPVHNIRSMELSVPRLGIANLPVPTGSSQARLDREGIIRLAGNGLPGKKGSNTFIVGHALGYPSTRVRFVFRHLEKLQPGDEIFLDSAGERYIFKVYDRLTVRPEDYWVTYPVTSKTIVSLQSCTPFPTFENRIVVRGELVG